MQKKLYALLSIIGGVLSLSLASLIKIHFIWGSKGAFFSGINIVGPLVGFYAGIPASIGIILSKIMLQTMSHGLQAIPLMMHIPTFFASFAFVRSSFLSRCFVPLICMFTFVIHPVGGQAWFYSLYWLIPCFIYLFRLNAVFFSALASTFVAHSVGSVLWLYLTKMEPELFAALMPVVIIERLLFALGITALYYVIKLSIIGLRRIALIDIKEWKLAIKGY